LANIRSSFIPRPLVIDGVPARLFRAYSKREHAQSLLTRGSVRLQRIEYYRTIEDAKRQDTAEGEAHLQVPGDVPVVRIDPKTGKIVGRHTTPGHFNWQMSFQNPTYALCLSQADVDLTELRSRFGEHIVEVFAPQRFVERLHTSAQNLQLHDRELAFVDCFSVRYEKGRVGAQPNEGSELMRLSYGQKAPAFAVEREYRCVVVLSGASADAPKWIDLELGDVSAFVRTYGSVDGGM
jgi:hypothetical protein